MRDAQESVAPFGYDGQPQMRTVLRAGKLVEVPISAGRTPSASDRQPQANITPWSSPTSASPMSCHVRVPVEIATDMAENIRALTTFEKLLESSQRDLHGHLLHEAVIKCLRKSGLVLDLGLFRSWLHGLDTRRNGTVSLKDLQDAISQARVQAGAVYPAVTRTATTPPLYHTMTTTTTGLSAESKPSPLRTVWAHPPSQPATTPAALFTHTPSEHNTQSFSRYQVLPPIGVGQPPASSEALRGPVVPFSNAGTRQIVSSATKEQPRSGRSRQDSSSSSPVPSTSIELTARPQPFQPYSADPRLCRSATDMNDWMQGFDAMNRAMLTQQDAHGYISSAEAARILSNFDLIYKLRLPKRAVVDLIQQLETDTFALHVQEFCRRLLELLHAVAEVQH
eukprot:m.44799 g.44799  ORF g.44799 m.44799 type:complete len:395 (-) comp12134_c0_seq2:38-1222(-)